MKMLKMTVWRRSSSSPIGRDNKTSPPSAVPDSRAERYFAKAAAYNAAASQMGFLSLEEPPCVLAGWGRLSGVRRLRQCRKRRNVGIKRDCGPGAAPQPGERV
jgi:hypothetical protein